MAIVMAKSQDVVVLLKWLCSPAKKSYAELASALGMSVGEVHAATQRAIASGLFDSEAMMPRLSALKEYLIHGVKYAFPASRGAPTRGMPTGYAAPPLKEHFQRDEVPGDTRWREFLIVHEPDVAGEFLERRFLVALELNERNPLREPVEIATVGLHRVVGQPTFGLHVVPERDDLGVQFGEAHGSPG